MRGDSISVRGNTQIIDPDKLDTTLDQKRSGLGIKGDKIFIEGGVAIRPTL